MKSGRNGKAQSIECEDLGVYLEECVGVYSTLEPAYKVIFVLLDKHSAELFGWRFSCALARVSSRLSANRCSGAPQ